MSWSVTPRPSGTADSQSTVHTSKRENKHKRTNKQNMSSLGLNQTQTGPKRVRRDPVRPPAREGPLWASVTGTGCMVGHVRQTLSSVARRVLAQPVCASAAERNWSVYGQVKTRERGRMGHAVGDN